MVGYSEKKKKKNVRKRKIYFTSFSILLFPPLPFQKPPPSLPRLCYIFIQRKKGKPLLPSLLPSLLPPPFILSNHFKKFKKSVNTKGIKHKPKKHMSGTKPTLPASYVVPEVWSPPSGSEGTFGGVNRPTAGARTTQALPRGEHALQLYSLGTPNGIKVTILLEELGVEYDAWKIPLLGKQFTSGFVEVNPNSKIPAMFDYGVGDGSDEPLRVFESGSILVYLADKFGAFLPPVSEIRKRTEVMNWVMWQMASAPFIGGGFGHFYKYAPVHIEYAVNRYSMETKRQLDVLDKQLEGKEYVCGEYSIADMAIFPWVTVLKWGYYAGDFLQVDSYKNVAAWCERLRERKAVRRGERVNGYFQNKVRERHSKADFKPEDY